MKIKKCWFIGADGEVKRLPELENKELSLKEMYPIVGCDMIEHVGLKRGVDMWVDEEGLLKEDWVINKKATKLFRDAYPHVDPRELGVVGNAIITDNTKAGDYING